MLRKNGTFAPVPTVVRGPYKTEDEMLLDVWRFSSEADIRQAIRNTIERDIAIIRSGIGLTEYHLSKDPQSGYWRDVHKKQTKSLNDAFDRLEKQKRVLQMRGYTPE